MKWHALTTLVYALLIIVGGMIGFAKAHSYMSLIMGAGSGVILLVAAWGLYSSSGWSFFLSTIVTGLLMLFFGCRLYTTQAFFPAGMMTIFSVATLFLLLMLPKKKIETSESGPK